MCYYNGIKVTREELLKLLHMEAIVKNYEILNRPLQSGFEYKDYPIVKPVNGGKEIVLEEAHWELLPWMVKTQADLPGFRKKYTTMNAKGENILTSAFFKDAARKRRCLVPSSGFFEWRHYKPIGSKKEEKYPYHISVKDRPYFYMAGIWQPWVDKETGESIDTFAIVTTAANPVMELVHNSKKRMPTILPDCLALEWISEGLSEERIAELGTYQLPAEDMEVHPIRKEFRQLEDPTEEYAYAELPPLGEDGKSPEPVSLFG
jgi:putative SOS response-associated peptidase YedK